MRLRLVADEPRYWRRLGVIGDASGLLETEAYRDPGRSFDRLAVAARRLEAGVEGGAPRGVLEAEG
jgi:hypothetical protein